MLKLHVPTQMDIIDHMLAQNSEVPMLELPQESERSLSERQMAYEGLMLPEHEFIEEDELVEQQAETADHYFMEH